MFEQPSFEGPARLRGRRIVAVLALALTSSLLSIEEASAQPQPPPNETEAPNKERARQHYVRALELHKNGTYAEAAAAYLSAHALYPKPAFLYNAAQVFRLAGEREKALDHYRRYVELEPAGDGSANAREFITELEAELAKPAKVVDPVVDPAADPKNNPDNPNKVVANGGEQTDGSGTTKTTDGSGNTNGPTASERTEPIAVVTRGSVAGRGRSKRIVGLVLSGVGLGVIGAGIGFGVHAKSLSTEASEYSGPAGPELDDLYDRGNAANRNMIVLMSAGALTAVTGGIVYYLGTRDRTFAEQDLELFIAPSSVGVSGRF